MASRKASHVKVDPQVAVKPSNAKGQPLAKNSRGKGSGHVKQTGARRTKNGYSRWLNDPYTTCFHGIRKFIILPLSSLLSGRLELWGWVYSLDPRFYPLAKLSLTYKSKTSVEEFAFRINSPTARQTRTSIPDCTFQQAGIRRGKIPILKTNSSRYAKSCLKTLWLANRIGRTTSQSTSERNLAS